MNFPSYANIVAAVHRHLITVLSDPEYSDFIRSIRDMRVEPCGSRDSRIVMVLADDEALAEFTPISPNFFAVDDESFAFFSFELPRAASA